MVDANIAGTDFSFASGLTAAHIASTANYKAKDLRGVSLATLSLAGLDLAEQELDGTIFNGATLSATTFTNARVAGARFAATVARGFTASQLYSTLSYQQHNLQRIGLASNNLSGWDFSNQDLKLADFTGATLTSANFSGADIASANFASTTSRGLTPAFLYATPNYQARDLRGVGLGSNNLTGWDFAAQNLTGASFANSTLSLASFTDANVTSANFSGTTSRGFTAAQLYSTASHKAHDLRGIVLSGNDLSGWDFKAQVLRGANLSAATLSNADFTDAIVSGATFSATGGASLTSQQLYSTASYKNRELQGISLISMNLAKWDFSNQNLTGATFKSGVYQADFTNADISRIKIESSGLSAAQWYSTASYKARNLQGISLATAALSDVDFSGQDLTGANLRSTTISSVNLSGAGLANTIFTPIMRDVDLTGADLRGADIRAFGKVGFLDNPFVNYRNIIRPDSTMDAAQWNDGETFILRDYDGPAPAGVLMNGDWGMSPGSAISVILRDLSWNSTMRFAAGSSVALAGTLELHLAGDFSASAFSPVEFRIFDWTGVTPTGSMAILSDPGVVWDTSGLLTNGTIQLIAVPEPAGAALLAGVAGLAMLRRRRCSNLPAHAV